METPTKPRVTARDFFLWLGAMVALYVSAVSLILLSHEYITLLIPDFNEYYSPYSGAIKFSIASLIVVFPLYIWLTRMLHQDIRKAPEKRELWVRRWLVVLTLFVAGFTIAADLVSVIFTFLNGDLTVRFFLKALAIVVVLGGGFWYYLHELKGTWIQKEKDSKRIALLVSLVVVAAVAGAFFFIGSPVAERSYRLDERRVSDLQTIQWQVVNYWQQKERLPESLADLEDPIAGFVAPTDPVTGAAYSYAPEGSMSFTLCATFDRQTRKEYETRPVSPYPANENWLHGEGEVCFERTIDPDLYPPYKK